MDENQSLLELEVDQETGTNITEMAKWARLFAILVSSIIGLFVLILFLFWRTLALYFSTMPELNDSQAGYGVMIGVSIVAIIFIAICTVILVYLFKGVNGLRNGVRNKDQLAFNIGLANLRNSFAIYAVATIVLVLIQLTGLF